MWTPGMNLPQPRLRKYLYRQAARVCVAATARDIHVSPVIDGLHIGAGHQRLLPRGTNPETQREVAPAGDKVLCKLQDLR